MSKNTKNKKGKKTTTQSHKTSEEKSSSFRTSQSGSSSGGKKSQKDKASRSNTSRGKFGKKHADWARGIMEDLREEWMEVDRNTYVQLKDYNPEIVQDIDKKADSIYDLLLKHES